MCNDRTDDDFRIGVMDVPASSADVSFARVPLRHTAFEVWTRRRRNEISWIGHALANLPKACT